MKIGEPVLTEEERRAIRARARAGETIPQIARDYPHAGERTLHTVARGLGQAAREARIDQVRALIRRGHSAQAISEWTGVPKSTITRWARTGLLARKRERPIPPHLLRGMPPWEDNAAWTAAAAQIVAQGYGVAALARALGRKRTTVLMRLQARENAPTQPEG